MEGIAEKTPLATEPRLNMTRDPHKDVLLEYKENSTPRIYLSTPPK